MNTSTEIKNIAVALNKLQSVVEAASKNSDNPYFKSKYADLNQVWQTIKKPLTDNGLSIIQTTGKDETGDYVETTLFHETGEFINGNKLYLKLVKQDMQSLGSAITYARRYSLMALLGICPEDDDGEKAMDRNGSIKKPQPKNGDLTTIINDLAKKRFKDPDEFKMWRVDNALAEELSNADDLEKSKIIIRLKEDAKARTQYT